MKERKGVENRDRKHTARKTKRAGRWPAVGGLVLIAVLCASASVSISADESGERLANARTVLEQWVETQRLISKERQEWKVDRVVLQDQIDLTEDQIANLREKIDEARGNIAEMDEKKIDLAQENERLKRAASAMAGMVATLEARTKELLARLPDPITERVKPLSQGIPKDPDNTKLSLGQRFEKIVGILNEVNKFNLEMTVTSEMRDLGGGETAEVTVLYVGIGHGYYVSADGEIAGVGSATPEGWMWAEANGAAKEIAKAIAILKNQETAQFVQLPVKVDE